MALNCVMMDPVSNTPVPLPNESILYHQGSVQFLLEHGSGYPGDSITIQAAQGTLYLTNQRVIYVSKKPSTPAFTDFTVPLANIRDGLFVQPWLAPNAYTCVILPTRVPNSPLPSGPCRLKLMFKEGGGFDFSSTLRSVSDRIAEGFQTPTVLEPLPTYSAAMQTGEGNSHHEAPPPGYTPAHAPAATPHVVGWNPEVTSPVETRRSTDNSVPEHLSPPPTYDESTTHS
ncbi:hypothetical protein IWQ60_005888 [Tieghemiomyces parasiticus]|uniref:GLUE N-terminal domain-containing protein n=1 Tax=Tieghemiomyces parasiticus TaxID=78921 RepID=A0A9W8AAZ1_9FUNG|nr:hypothetical protein IWQ60_005888 [Tieghemiomyces parasiticus]